MVRDTSERYFSPGGCLTFFAIRSFLDGSAGLAAKARIEEHVRNCKLCSDALEGFRSHSRTAGLDSEMNLLSRNVSHHFRAQRYRIAPRFQFQIVIAVALSIVLLVIAFYIVWKLAS